MSSFEKTTPKGANNVIILLYIVIGVLAIGFTLFIAWIVIVITWPLFGDIIERKLKIMETRKKWEKED